ARIGRNAASQSAEQRDIRAVRTRETQKGESARRSKENRLTAKKNSLGHLGREDARDANHSDRP
ncbi:hypothetical protein KI387_030421, partial [Taxus chinensis]